MAPWVTAPNCTRAPCRARAMRVKSRTTLTALAAPSGWPRASAPPSGLSSSSKSKASRSARACAAEVSDIGDNSAFSARFRAGHFQRHDLADEAALARRLLGLDMRLQRVAILSMSRDAEAPRQLLGGHDRMRCLGAAAAVLRLETH